jgi:hypothetical protein
LRGGGEDRDGLAFGFDEDEERDVPGVGAGPFADLSEAKIGRVAEAAEVDVGDVEDYETGLFEAGSIVCGEDCDALRAEEPEGGGLEEEAADGVGIDVDFQGAETGVELGLAAGVAVGEDFGEGEFVGMFFVELGEWGGGQAAREVGPELGELGIDESQDARVGGLGVGVVGAEDLDLVAFQLGGEVAGDPEESCVHRDARI